MIERHVDDNTKLLDEEVGENVAEEKVGASD